MQNCCTISTLPGRESDSATVLHGMVDNSTLLQYLLAEAIVRQFSIGPSITRQFCSIHMNNKSMYWGML